MKTSSLSAVEKNSKAVANSESSGKMVNSSSNGTSQLQSREAPKTIQLKSNGIPNQLKVGIESLSGYNMDDVKVHYNSPKPAQLQAHAFAQGNSIHLASGQEKHLAHEAWHVVQQKQGRVNPTRQLKEKVQINDDKGLEKEADTMGNKALSFSNSASSNSPSPSSSLRSSNIKHTLQRKIKYSQKDGYTADASRPSWLVHAESAMLEEYNSFTKQTLEKVLYKKEKLARCHVLSFDAIQTQVLNYLKDPSTAVAFKAFVNHFIDGLGSDNQEHKNIVAVLTLLQTAIDKPESAAIITVLANKLLSLLNSLTLNLRAADKYLNSFIQNKPDLVFTEDASGVFHLSAYGKAILDLGVEITLPLPRSPGRTSIITSQGKVALGSMSPGTFDAVDSYAHESSKVHSKNVSSRLQGSSAVSAFRAHESTVDPQVLEAIAKEREELLGIEKHHVSKYHEMDKEILYLKGVIEHLDLEEQERSLHLISELHGMEQQGGELSEHLHGLLGQLAKLESELETIEDVFQRGLNHKYTIAYLSLAAKSELTEQEQAKKNLLSSHSIVQGYLNGLKMRDSHRALMHQLRLEIDELKQRLTQLEREKKGLQVHIQESRDYSKHKIDDLIARVSHAESFQAEVMGDIIHVREKIASLDSKLR